VLFLFALACGRQFFLLQLGWSRQFALVERALLSGHRTSATFCVKPLADLATTVPRRKYETSVEFGGGAAEIPTEVGVGDDVARTPLAPVLVFDLPPWIAFDEGNDGEGQGAACGLFSFSIPDPLDDVDREIADGLGEDE
jgi:hypothetical protein